MVPDALGNWREVGVVAARVGVVVSDDGEAFALWIRALDEWRVIPYRDPGLPSSALPADWPAAASAALFRRLRSGLEARALAHAAAVAGPARTVGSAR